MNGCSRSLSDRKVIVDDAAAGRHSGVRARLGGSALWARGRGPRAAISGLIVLHDDNDFVTAAANLDDVFERSVRDRPALPDLPLEARSAGRVRCSRAPRGCRTPLCYKGGRISWSSGPRLLWLPDDVAPGWMSRRGSCWTARGSTRSASTLCGRAPPTDGQTRAPVPSMRSARTV